MTGLRPKSSAWRKATNVDEFLTSMVFLIALTMTGSPRRMEPRPFRWRVSWILCVFLSLLLMASTKATPYRLGNFAVSSNNPSLGLSPIRAFWQEEKQKFETWIGQGENRLRLVRLTVFVWCTKNSVVSILNDTWELERHPLSLKREVRNPFVRRNVASRVERDRYLRKLVGAGYTPRLVWLYGVMLRGVLQCTAIPKVFNPPIGWGAGAALAARYAVREWLPCILLGWYGSEWYWKMLFGVKGAPDNKKNDFDGVPIAVKKVQM